MCDNLKYNLLKTYCGCCSSLRVLLLFWIVSPIHAQAVDLSVNPPHISIKSQKTRFEFSSHQKIAEVSAQLKARHQSNISDQQASFTSKQLVCLASLTSAKSKKYCHQVVFSYRYPEELRLIRDKAVNDFYMIFPIHYAIHTYTAVGYMPPPELAV